MEIQRRARDELETRRLMLYEGLEPVNYKSHKKILHSLSSYHSAVLVKYGLEPSSLPATKRQYHLSILLHVHVGIRKKPCHISCMTALCPLLFPLSLQDGRRRHLQHLQRCFVCPLSLVKKSVYGHSFVWRPLLLSPKLHRTGTSIGKGIRLQYLQIHNLHTVASAGLRAKQGTANLLLYRDALGKKVVLAGKGATLSFDNM